MTDKLVIIDTDAGIDDAWAIFMALAAQRDLVTPAFRIIGITTTCGNTTEDHVANNVTRTLDTVNDTTTRIYRGMNSFVLKKFQYQNDPPYFGEDGFGDANLPEIPTRAQPGHAVDFIINFAQIYQGQLTLVCLGPLTNLGIAIRKEPRLREWLKEIYILGGNIHGVGNVDGVTSSAEFNFFVDPEAAQITLDSFEGVPIYGLPWEILLQHSSSYEFRTETLANLGTPTIELLNTIEAGYLDRNRDSWLPADAMLMACVIDPSIITRTEEHRYDIELTGTLTRGMMVQERDSNSTREPNLRIIMQIDQSKYEALLIWAAGGPRPSP